MSNRLSFVVTLLAWVFGTIAILDAKRRLKDCEASITSARVEAMEAIGQAKAIGEQMDAIRAERDAAQVKVDSLEGVLFYVRLRPIPKAPKDAEGLRKGILEAIDEQ